MSDQRSCAYHVMAKPAGSACNLSCRYCFYLQKERLYAGSRARMDDRVLEAFIRQYIGSQISDEVVISWQGGEPCLMGLDFFARSVEIAESCAGGRQVSYTIQTNGTLIDDDWCSFFRKHRFLLGLSLDGPREMHDAYRVDRQGRPTYGKVERAARMLQDKGVDFNILCSVHPANAGHPRDVYRFFTNELQADWIQFIPIVERINEDGTTLLQQGDSVTDRSVEPEQWGDFLLGVFSEWIERDVGKVHVNFFESAFASWVGEPALMCIFQETCGNALALEHNGDLYSCDHFVEPDYLLGNIVSEPMGSLVSSGKQRSFGEAKRDSLPAFCKECDFLFACRGECPKNRFKTAPDAEPGLSYLCEGYRKFFSRVGEPMKLMAHLYESGHSPAGIMELLDPGGRGSGDASIRVGRNDPCPCGSGKKFKVCHGR